MQRIHHLDSLTVDKIAAGEVIDVPASCVKELVENSLDAGAEDILIEIQLGGRELIRVSDTGCGMCREDVVASIERHATSKIACVEDLERISSMGFRGEALASIVAISRVKMTSAEHGNEPLSAATTLHVEGGEVVSIVETKAPCGTSVEVRDLFYNIPARRKFLKSPSKDAQDIIKTVTCLALAAPQASFRLIVDGKQVIGAQKEEDLSFVMRAKKLLQEPFQGGFDVRYEHEGCALQGIICRPETAKTNRSGQYLFVNRRSVFSLPLSYAVKAGCGTACEQHKHPQFILSLTLDPSSIDINVHPQKKEIRFADEEWIRTFVQEKVSEALFGKRNFSFHVSEEKDVPTDWSFLTEHDFISSTVNPELFSHVEANQRSPIACSKVIGVLGEIALIQVDGVEHELVLLNLQRAMKAALFHELMSKKGKPISEPLLIPITVECRKEEYDAVVAKLSVLENHGFVLRPFGSSSFLVEEVPQGLRDVHVSDFILEMAVHPEILQERDLSVKCARLAGLYVSLMKGLRPPITLEIAQRVFARYEACGSPQIAPDGSSCKGSLSHLSLKEYF